MTQQSSGWYADPTNGYEYRYWNGTQWTNQVSSSGVTLTDPNEIDPSIGATPPAPGSKAPTTPQPAPATPQAATVPSVQVTQKSGSPIGIIIGVVVVLFVVVVLIVVLANQSGDDSTETPETPVTTEAPATTEAP